MDTRTNIVSTKKNSVRHMTFRIERGSVFSGFSLSPEAIPTSSVPWNEKFTITRVNSTAWAPFGKSPLSVVKFDRYGAVCPPLKPTKPNTAAAAENNKQYNGHDLNAGKPKFHFRKTPRRQRVNGKNDDAEYQAPHPNRNGRKPSPH